MEKSILVLESPDNLFLKKIIPKIQNRLYNEWVDTNQQNIQMPVNVAHWVLHHQVQHPVETRTYLWEMAKDVILEVPKKDIHSASN